MADDSTSPPDADAAPPSRPRTRKRATAAAGAAQAPKRKRRAPSKPRARKPKPLNGPMAPEDAEIAAALKMFSGVDLAAPEEPPVVPIPPLAPAEHVSALPEIEIEVEVEGAAEVEPEPPPIVLKTPAPRQLAPAPRLSERVFAAAGNDLTYLERARLAAQSKADAPRGASWSAFLSKEATGWTARQAIAAGLVAPALLGVAWALQQTSPSPDARAPALEMQDESGQGPLSSADYQRALALLSDGDIEAGVAALQRAAEDGFAPAQYRLSKLYERGAGVPQDMTLALRWAQAAADAGNVQAMHDAGVYVAARGDARSAFRWFRAAAAHGVADSQYNLGVFYAEGRGVGANRGEALFWFLVAARHGDGDAADRAIELSMAMPTTQIAQARARARAFQARAALASANAPDDAAASAAFARAFAAQTQG